MKNLLLTGLLISFLSIFSTGCNDSGGDDSSTNPNTGTEEEIEVTYQDYVDYAEANNRAVSRCEQNLSCDYCGFTGNTAECDIPPMFCADTESCQ